MKRLIKEPLVHFLALGALLFASYGLLNRNSTSAPGRIVISQGQVTALMANFTLLQQRLPTREELEGLIRADVRGEVYYREALALGLDKDDAIIRRRLEQKMEFISDDTAAQDQPTDADLNAFLQAHPDRFRVEPQFTFRQLYLNPEKHGTNLAGDAAQLLAKLNQPGGDAGWATMGDPFPLDKSYAAIRTGAIASQFGNEFTAKLGGLPTGRWQGPIDSSFGAHLVCISERTASRLPALAEVRDAVRREWEENQRLEANEKFYQTLLKHYTVTIEKPAAVEKDKKLAEAKAQ